MIIMLIRSTRHATSESPNIITTRFLLVEDLLFRFSIEAHYWLHLITGTIMYFLIYRDYWPGHCPFGMHLTGS